MIWAFLTAKKLGLAKGLWIAVAAAALIGGYLWLRARENADDRANQEIGAELERANDIAETLDRTEKADAAEENLDRDPDARRAGCVRHSRTPENC